MSSAQQRLQQAWQWHQRGHIEEAEAAYRQVLHESPQDADAMVFLGIVLFDQRRFAESVEMYQQALTIRSEFPVAWNNLGNSFRMLGQIEDADRCFAESLRQQPDYLSAIKNRGTLWLWTGDIDQGLRWYQQGLAVDASDAELHRNLGVIHLLRGEFDLAWPEYRWRWKMPGMSRPNVSAPLWQGQSLENKVVLLYPEQGLGDSIQFVRTASQLSALGAEVILQIPPSMVPLFSSAAGVSRMILDTTIPPPVDYHVSMIDAVDVMYQLSGQMPWGDECFADTGGYLTVSDPLIDYWRRWLDDHAHGCRVGINWQGNRGHQADLYRSAPLTIFQQLADLPQLTLVSLQFGDGVDQIDRCSFADRLIRLPEHVDADGGAFTDSAAIVRNLDAVVTTDTSIAHLAGAMGTPTHLLLGKIPDWRWGLQGDQTSWYPSLTLWRQSQLGQWESVMRKVARALHTVER